MKPLPDQDEEKKIEMTGNGPALVFVMLAIANGHFCEVDKMVRREGADDEEVLPENKA